MRAKGFDGVVTEATPESPPHVHRNWFRLIRLIAIIAVFILLAAAIVVILLRNSAPTKRELLEEAGLLGKKEFLIGVIDDTPRLSERDATGKFNGFDIDMGYMVASYLGFNTNETKFVSLVSENRASMRAYLDKGQWVTVDLVVASYSITEEREKRPDVAFSAPYAVTWQSVVSRKGHSVIRDLSDLKDRLVCTIGTATSEKAADNAGVRLTRKPKVSECVKGLLSEQFEAVTTDAALLAGFVARYPDKLMHHDIALDTVENWGMNAGRNAALLTLVNRALWLSRYDPRNREWENAYDKWFRPMLQVNDPQDVALDQQPDIPKVEVRQDLWGLLD